MKYAIIEDGVVINIALADEPLAGNWVPLTMPANVGDLWDGSVFTAPTKDPQVVQDEVVAATQARLDAFAKTRNYDGILSACTYATSSVPQFAAEGQYAVSARDTTWATLYTVMGEVQAGTRPMPDSFADIEPLLPELVWP